jgi:Flp pilus assembly protein TadB
MSLAFDPPVERKPLDGASRTVSTEEAFEALSNQRRRYVVHWLLETETETGTEIRELSRRVAAWENDKPADRVTAQERRRVYNALQQFHLPKLDEVGVIRYDADRGVVEATDDLRSLRAYLDASRRSHRWCSRSVVLGGGVAGLVAALTGLWWLGPLPGAAIAVLVVGAAFVVAIVVHRFLERRGGVDPRPAGTND